MPASPRSPQLHSPARLLGPDLHAVDDIVEHAEDPVIEHLGPRALVRPHRGDMPQAEMSAAMWSLAMKGGCRSRPRFQDAWSRRWASFLYLRYSALRRTSPSGPARMPPEIDTVSYPSVANRAPAASLFLRGGRCRPGHGGSRAPRSLAAARPTPCRPSRDRSGTGSRRASRRRPILRPTMGSADHIGDEFAPPARLPAREVKGGKPVPQFLVRVRREEAMFPEWRFAP